jgi:hypothetical protein
MRGPEPPPPLRPIPAPAAGPRGGSDSRASTPRCTPPAWLRAILESAKHWGPILAGNVLAVREWRKRNRRPDTT